MRHAVLDWGGSGEPLVLLHPNGLCAGFFDPLARRLVGDHRVVGLDLRGHGGTDQPRTRADLAYAPMARGVLGVLDALGITGCSIVGESLGGGVATIVDRERPGVVRRLVLCEAIAFDWGAGAAAVAGGDEGRSGNFLADLARRRRAVWPDRAAARARYSAGPPFDAVSAESLDGYVRWGLRDRPDGQVELACPPETEASLFEVSSEPEGAESAFAHLPSVGARAVVFHGDASYLPAPWFQAQADAAGVPLRAVRGGHFFLQEDDDRAAGLVREALAG